MMRRAPTDQYMTCTMPETGTGEIAAISNNRTKVVVAVVVAAVFHTMTGTDKPQP